MKTRKKINKRVRACRVCGCTDADCSDCIERTGEPCHWVEIDLCSACVDPITGEAIKEKDLKRVGPMGVES
jgi:hypothetical protein